MAKDFYISLIYKELEGSITAGEQRELDDWSKAPRNGAIKQQICNVWNLSEGYEEPLTTELDIDLEFAAIQTKIKSGNNVKSISSSAKSTNWMSVAASVAILIAAIFGIQQLSDNSSEMVSHMATESNEYHLLEDGSEIYLQKGSKISYYQPFDKDRRVINLESTLR